MEKTLKLTWSDVAKWLVLIAGIATTYGVMQHRISTLEEGREMNARNIELLENRMRTQEAQVSAILSKLQTMSEDVRDIKNFLLDDSHASGR